MLFTIFLSQPSIWDDPAFVDGIKGLVAALLIVGFVIAVRRLIRKHKRKREKEDEPYFYSSSYGSDISHQPAKQEYFPYSKKHYLLTQTEYVFYLTLRECVSTDFIICPKVCLNDIFYVQKHIRNHEYFRRRYSQKHVDFLICDAQSISPVCGIELDDPSHNNPETMERDDFVNRLYHAAGLPLFHIPVSSSYSIEAISNLLYPLARR